MMELSSSAAACGYSVLINTPTWLNEQAENIRYEFIEGAKDQGIAGVKSCIPLVNLLTADGEGFEEKVLQSVGKIASMIHCFQVSYTGFSFFDASENFRINVKDEEPLVSLRDLLQGALQSSQLLSYTATPGFSAPDFTGAIQGSQGTSHEFISSAATNYFRADSVSILKKVAGDEAWQLVKEIPFGRA